MERTFRTVGDGYAEMEYIILVLGTEDEVVFAIHHTYIIIPHLATSPGNVFQLEHAAMVCHFTVFDVVQ